MATLAVERVAEIEGKRQVYAMRLSLLAQKRRQQTLVKFDRQGFMDHDDTGVGVLEKEVDWGFVTHHDGLCDGAELAGRNFRLLAEKHPPYVDADSAFVGKVYQVLPLHWNPAFSYDHLTSTHDRYDILPGIVSRDKISPDFSIGMALGWEGLLEKVRRCGEENGSDEETTAFYKGEEDVILGMQAWIRNTSGEIRSKLGTVVDPDSRTNLEEMLSVNEWIADKPPRTFREACQHLVWMNHLVRAYTGSGGGCQLDELLYPFYVRDIELGEIDDEDAIYYVACLLISDARHYAIGGLDEHGADMSSPLSYVILEALHRIGVAGNMNVRCHAEMDPAFFRLAVEYALEDKTGAIRFSNVDALVEGFVRNGYPVELARCRRATTCNWNTIPGREYTMNDLIKINLAKVFEAAYLGMMAGAAAKSLDTLWDLYQSHLREANLCVARGIDFKHGCNYHSTPELALNLFCHGPIEKGVDAVCGGLEFYHFCVAGAGLATVADSFAAIEQRVVREGALDWETLHRHITSDFAGAEGERVLWMLQASERYGQDTGSLGDTWAKRVSQLYVRLVRERPTPDGLTMLPQFYSWRQALEMGQSVGATPNGRRAGKPISTGPNPHDGSRRDGAATALANAVASVQTGYGNGDILYIDLDPGLADSVVADKIGALIRGHFSEGGTSVFLNILDLETLKAAHSRPETYPELIVRVAGFTAHFAVLSPEVRQMVVDRGVERSR